LAAANLASAKKSPADAEDLTYFPTFSAKSSADFVRYAANRSPFLQTLSSRAEKFEKLNSAVSFLNKVFLGMPESRIFQMRRSLAAEVLLLA
jgi:hypothetical protein